MLPRLSVEECKVYTARHEPWFNITQFQIVER